MVKLSDKEHVAPELRAMRVISRGQAVAKEQYYKRLNKEIEALGKNRRKRKAI